MLRLAQLYKVRLFVAHQVGLEPSKIAILPIKHTQATFGARAHMGKEVKLMREP